MPQEPEPVEPVKRPTAEKPTDETVKETLEAIIVAFVLAFVFRAYVVEAFVIPTGSMAPTLLGDHADVVCSQCGYRFAVDLPEGGHSPVTLPPAVCPMCHFPNASVFRRSAGDRILVHKFIYSLVEPRRWDVVVFKNPQEINQADNSPGPTTNYIKRLVGLPHELLEIIDGNLYVKKSDSESDLWHIARKTGRPKVQRAVWQPVYHSSYVPLDKGRLTVQRVTHPWKTPWEASKPGDWEMEGLRSYSHTTADPGTINFSFNVAASGVGWYAYNEFRGQGFLEPIEDVRIAAAFQPEHDGLAVRLRTTARLDSVSNSTPVYILSARIDSKGHATLEKQDHLDAEPEVLISGETTPFVPGETRQVELWYVDQQASLWVDGKRLLVKNFDLPSIEAAEARDPAPAYPRVAIDVAGTPVTLHRVELDRDIYYSSGMFPNGRNQGRPGTGVFVKSGNIREGKPLHLEADQFFCLGDNSPLSLDGRYWNTIDPWVEKRFFDDEGHQQKFGIVPRKLLMGRAFFVYFPAPFALTPGGPNVFPNFGDMRFIH